MKDTPTIKRLCKDIDKAHQALIDELQKEIDKRMKVLNSIPMLKTLLFRTGYGSQYFTLLTRDKKIPEYYATRIIHEGRTLDWMKKRWPMIEEIYSIDTRMDNIGRWETGA